MATTPRLGLTKPLQTDFYNIDVHNGNSDIIDLAVKNLQDNKEDKVTGGFFTNRVNYLPANTDLLNFLTEGHYSSGNATNTATISNKPFGISQFILVVTSYVVDNVDFCTHIYYKGVGNTAEMAIRSKVNGIWNDLTFFATQEELNLKANRAGDTFTGNVLIKHSAPILSLDTTIANGSNYIQGRASDNTVIWNLGNATSTNNLVINSVKNNTALSFKSDRLESNRDVYVGAVRLVKLPELTATNTNVTNLTTRTTNLENSRALQTSLDATNGRVTALEAVQKGANYIIHANGFKECWGQVTLLGGDENWRNLTLPISFTNTTYNISTNTYVPGTGDGQMMAAIVSANTIQYRNNWSGPMPQGVGYWYCCGY